MTINRNSGQSIPEIFHSLRCRWGEEWIVDRLLQIAGREENEWLEFKATMSPPADRIEKYQNDLPKYVLGDYVLHTLRAVVAFANNGYGGIVLLGVAEKKTKDGKKNILVPADTAYLCVDKKKLPRNAGVSSGDSYWDTDGWEQGIHMLLRNNSFEDRYQCNWSCSVNLDSRIEFHKGIFHRHPVLILIVSPEPSPIWLNREMEIAPKKCRCETAGKMGHCHFPHDKPKSEKVIHIMKRVGKSVNEWDDPQDLINRWNSRSVPYSDFGSPDDDEFERFSNGNTSFLGAFSAMRKWSFSTVAAFLKKNGQDIEQGGPIPEFVNKSQACCFLCQPGIDYAVSAGILCRNLLYSHELSKPLPLFLKNLTPDWPQKLKKSTKNFFTTQLILLGRGAFSVKNVDFFGQNGNLMFILVTPEFSSPELEELWWSAVTSLRAEFFNCWFLLFCSSRPKFSAEGDIEYISWDLLDNELTDKEKK